MLQQYAAKRGGQESLLENMNSKYYYYTRTKGLSRICYPKERPPTGMERMMFQSTVSKFYCVALPKYSPKYYC